MGSNAGVMPQQLFGAARGDSDWDQYLVNALNEMNAGRYAEAASWANMVPNKSSREKNRNDVLAQISERQGAALAPKPPKMVGEEDIKKRITQKEEFGKRSGRAGTILTSPLGTYGGLNAGKTLLGM